MAPVGGPRSETEESELRGRVPPNSNPTVAGRIADLTVLGLFDWEDLLLTEKDIEDVARALLGVPDRETLRRQNQAKGGWFAREFQELAAGFPAVRVVVGVTHSRVIVRAEIQVCPQPSSLHEFRDIRHQVEARILQFLNGGVEVGGHEPGSLISRLLTRRPHNPILIFTYPIYSLAPDSQVYQTEFPQESLIRFRGARSTRNLGHADPIDISTSCFFAGVEDVLGSRGIWGSMRQTLRPVVIYMRVSGASLMMRSSSDAFLQRVINILYFDGLYQMIRESKRHPIEPTPGLAHICKGLEPLLESQGQALTETFTHEIQERKVEFLSMWVLILTVLGLGVAALAIALKVGPF